MTSLEAALQNAARALRATGLRWAVAGGLAVSARAEPRTTRDVDLAVAVNDDEARDAVRLIEERGFAWGRKLSSELEDLLVRERR